MKNQVQVEKRTRVTGPERDQLRTRVMRMYVDEQMSVRAIASAIGRSYGAVYALLEEAQVSMRPRGNPKVVLPVG